MTWFAVVLIALLPLGFAAWLWRRGAERAALPWRRGLLLAFFGGLSAAGATWVEEQALAFTGLDVGAEDAIVGLSLFAVLFAAPLEEALKVGVTWPLYLSRRLTSGRIAALHVAAVVGGFACVDAVLWHAFDQERTWIDVVRLSLALPGHFFFSGLWGYLLGLERRDRFFGLVWMLCAALRGAYDHLLFGRSAAFLVVALPVVILLGVGTFLMFRQHEESQTRGPSSSHSLLERASVASVRRALTRSHRPVMVHWILLGVLVTFGVTLVLLGCAVYLGHAWGIDFSLANEEGMRGLLPVALLVAALLLAFPFSGYLIARASGAASVLEPAWATGATILVVLGVFSVTEPSAVVIALAIAPVGLTLACVGAWLGLDRS